MRNNQHPCRIWWQQPDGKLLNSFQLGDIEVCIHECVSAQWKTANPGGFLDSCHEKKLAAHFSDFSTEMLWRFSLPKMHKLKKTFSLQCL